MDTLLLFQGVAIIFNWHNASLIAAFWVLQYMLRLLYNISPFHPLYYIPGPNLAAMSYLYEFYFNVVQKGRYTAEIKRLHEIYGPVIRINPDELHCSDPGFVDEIYSGISRKRDKPYFQLSHLEGPNSHSGFATVDHDLHRRRRAPLSKFFSKAQISRLEPQIHDQAQQLCNNFLLHTNTSRPFDLTSAYSCFTSDVISAYCFGKSFGFLEQKAFEPNFRRAIYAVLNTHHLFKFFPWLKILTRFQPYFTKYMPEDIAILSKTANVDIPNMIKKAKVESDAGIERHTVFDALFNSDLPPEEKTIFRLGGEAMALLGAGTETTSWALSVITFHVLSNVDIYTRLTRELQDAVDNPLNLPRCSTLEQLPYLSSVILEGLRLSYGVPGRTARTPTGEALIYRGSWTPPTAEKSISVSYVIPRGTPIGMSPYIMHHNEMVFYDSETFLPERWLDSEGQRDKHLERYLLSFSKGTRQCLGINLAHCELHLALAALVLRVYPHLKLYETSNEDVKYDYELMVPMAKKGSQGVRVLVV